MYCSDQARAPSCPPPPHAPTLPPLLPSHLAYLVSHLLRRLFGAGRERVKKAGRVCTLIHHLCSQFRAIPMTACAYHQGKNRFTPTMPTEEGRRWLHKQDGVENEDSYMDNSKSKHAFSEEVFTTWVHRTRGRKPEPRGRRPEAPRSGPEGAAVRALCAGLAGVALWGPAGVPALGSLPGLSRAER